MNIEEILISQIDKQKFNLRDSNQDKGHQRLENSITKVGLLQPVIVQTDKDGEYVLIAGHRRVAALEAQGHEKVQAVVLSADEPEAIKIALTENLVRRQLNTLEIIKGLQMLEKQGISQKDMAALFGWKKGQISNMLAITKLHAKAKSEVNEALKNNEIFYGHAKALLALRDYPEELLRILDQVRGSPPKCTVRVTECLVRKAVATINEKQLPKFNFSLPGRISLEERAKSNRLVIRFDNRDELESILTEFILENSFHVKTEKDAEE